MTGRRRGDPVPRPPARASRTPTTATGASGSSTRATRLTEEHNPLYVRKHAGRAPRDRAPRRAELHRALPRLRAIRSTTSPTSAARFLDSTERLWEDAGDRFFRSRIGARARRDRALGRRARLARRDVGRGVPEGADGARARGDARATSASTCTRSATSSSTSRTARTSRRARSACAIEIPDRVILVIKPQGGPDDWRALFHEAGPHRALRAHVAVAHGRGAAARRQRGHRGLGDAARAPDDRPGVARPAARLPAPARVRGRGRDAAALARAPLLREAALRDRVPRRARRRRRCARATSSCSATR